MGTRKGNATDQRAMKTACEKYHRDLRDLLAIFGGENPPKSDT